MFRLLSGLIWIVGSIIVVTFLINFAFGYEINLTLLDQSRQSCWNAVVGCKDDFFKHGISSDKCQLQCWEKGQWFQHR